MSDLSVQREFNKICAQIMRIELYDFTLATETQPRQYIEGGSVVYDPYNDMNQLCEVVDAIRHKHFWSCQALTTENINETERVKAIWFNFHKNTYIGSNLPDALRSVIWEYHSEK